MPKIYYWLLMAVIAWAAVLVLVPWPKIRKLLGVGFWGGLVLTIVIQAAAVYFLGLWKFNYMLIPTLGFPVFLPFMWFAETIIFINFLPEERNNRIVYITAISAATTLLGYFILTAGLQTYIRWNLFYNFILSLVSHSAIAYFYLARVGSTKIRT